MKKDVLITLAAFFIILLFAGLTALVFLRPRPRLIQLKLKLGAMILSLTMLASCSGEPIEQTCYKPAFPPDTTKSNDTVTPQANPKDTIKANEISPPVYNL